MLWGPCGKWLSIESSPLGQLDDYGHDFNKNVVKRKQTVLKMSINISRKLVLTSFNSSSKL